MNRDQSFRRTSLIVIAILAFVGIIVKFDPLVSLFTEVIGILSPFIAGGVFAFVLNIPVTFIEKYLKKWRGKKEKWFRPVSVLGAFSLVILLIYLIIFMVLPDIQMTIETFIVSIPKIGQAIVKWGNEWLDRNPQLITIARNMNIDPASIQSRLMNMVNTLGSLATQTLQGIVTFGVNVVNGLVNTLITVVFGLSILFGKETLTRQAKQIIYAIFSLKWANYIVNVVHFSRGVFTNYVKGVLTEALILGSMVYVGMLIFHFPFALTIAAIIASLALIPIFGAVIGAGIGALLIAVSDFSLGLWFIVFVTIVQQIEGNLIYPNVVGGSVGFPGLWTLLVVILAGSLFGLPGMVVSVPLMSVVYQLLGINIKAILKRKNIHVDAHTRNVKKEHLLPPSEEEKTEEKEN